MLSFYPSPVRDAGGAVESHATEFLNSGMRMNMHFYGHNRIQRLIYGPGPDVPPETPPAKTYGQADVDSIVGKTKAELQRKFDTERATILERTKVLETDAGKAAELEKQIEELNNRYKSKEELALDALKKERDVREEKHKALEGERDSWRKKYEDQTLMMDLTMSASKKAKTADGKDIEVHNPAQLVKFLRPDARVVEKLVDGKPTGLLETRIKFTDSKGKELDLTPDEVVKVMSEDPQHHNFFKSGVIGGLGASGGKQGGGSDGLLSMTQDEFTKRMLAGTLPKRK